MLSVIIICKNEEANIKRCLESVSWADEIIVLDSGSTDNTIAIAQEYTDNVYKSEDWHGYGIQKQRALNLATGDWVLNIDADESITDDLRTTIEEAIKSDEVDAYRIPICMNFYDKPLRYSSSPKRHIRLFKREGAQYSDDIVHEKIILPPETRIGKIVLPIMHHSFRDVSHALYKINRYTSYSAKIRSQKAEPPGIMSILSSTVWMFFRCFFLQRGFMDGAAGFLLAVFNAQGTFYRGIKQLYPDFKYSASLAPAKQEVQEVADLPSGQIPADHNNQVQKQKQKVEEDIPELAIHSLQQESEQEQLAEEMIEKDELIPEVTAPDEKIIEEQHEINHQDRLIEPEKSLDDSVPFYPFQQESEQEQLAEEMIEKDELIPEVTAPEKIIEEQHEINHEDTLIEPEKSLDDSAPFYPFQQESEQEQLAEEMIEKDELIPEVTAPDERIIEEQHEINHQDTLIEPEKSLDDNAPLKKKKKK
ncbi:lipopolysaccharide biosynthesis glycosyltransferase [Legionella busanensis]|uniref:Lipopolysaccharide biosynthesis glycosyltransferase n=1 Tax=Legionella busanensis TaxID=190655 RepID=A0A378JI16_9GAMM|nr:glycosyltransferase family 2 protein [Legionella busanensis]STX50835.1 lipopolysaccharide biosynthesis glycosyltransferase [Legionella busanensis]